ncbi:hypothetical protein [Piscinibacter sp. XHJ-5]|uniref:hypothetical protein n=1 Tax=Piscinibacter sp. XHJ-5 TaxID=3037797 RepID=UPI00245338BA|nr:hypothetical protein [Piscinibacter sp. XHJ-5]
MLSTRFVRSAIAATLLIGGATAALAEGDIYSRLAESRAKMMRADAGEMITKSQYLEYVGNAWDMKAAEMRSKDGSLTKAQLKELEKALGRMLGS